MAGEERARKSHTLCATEGWLTLPRTGFEELDPLQALQRVFVATWHALGVWGYYTKP